jgi:hypothetical protein
MAGEFSVPSHTIYFAGYLDAVGRHYTDEKRLCSLTAAVMPSKILDRLAIRTTTPVENMVREFERDISRFLNTDPKNRLLFYLTEYFCWYKDFSDMCVCEKLRLEGGDLSHDHTAYRLFVDHKHEVLFLAYWKDKGAMPNNSLERSRPEIR